MARVYWIRHGESEASDPKRRLPQYSGSAKLTKRGLAMAAEIKETLEQKGITPNLIFISPFTRAVETADPTAAHFFPGEKYHHKVGLHIDINHHIQIWHLLEELTYLNPKDYIGRTLDEAEPDKIEYWTKLDSEFILKGAPSDGMSFSQFVLRVKHVLENLAQLPENYVVLVFGHEQFMQVVRLLEAFPNATDAQLMRMFYEVTIKLPEHEPTSRIKNAQVIKSVVNRNGITIEGKDRVTLKHLEALPPEMLQEISGNSRPR